MESEEDLAARLTERLPIEEAEECLCQLEEHCITVGVLGEADAQDLADELGFTERQCDAVLLDDEAWQARYGQGQAGAPGVQQATTNMAVQEPSGEATPDSNLAENDPGVSSVPADALSAETRKKEPDSCDGDGPLLQVSSHRHTQTLRIQMLTTGRATRTLNAILRAATPSPCALPSGHPSGGTAQRAPSVSLAPSHFLSDYGSGAVAASRSAGCCRAHLVKTRQDKKHTSAPPPFPLTHPHTSSPSLTH